MTQNQNQKRELQEEADPAVLKAKQAATGQFSATNNLDKNSDNASDIGSHKTDATAATKN